MLTEHDLLIPDAVEAATDVAGLATASGAEAAALAIAAVRLGSTASVSALIAKLAEDGVAGLAAAWALGHLGAEAAVCAVIPDGRIDTRQNGYHALAVTAALGKATPALAVWLRTRVGAELEKAKAGGTGLADHALKVLAILGDPDTAALAQAVIEGDRFSDRFELARLRTAVADHGRDRDAIRDLTAPWRTVFADHLVKPPVAKPEAPAKAEAPAKPAAKPTTAARPGPPPRLAPAPAPAPEPEAHFAEEAVGPEGEPPFADDGSELGGEPGAEGEGLPPQIDWEAFATSPEFTALAPQAQGLVAQLGPMLEQLSAQGLRALLADLNTKEFVSLLLQVLPQALQPQHVQMALHPLALNGYQALAKYLQREGLATQGDAILQGVKLVRKQLQAQMRRSGMLGGPDYSDPDEAQATV